MSILSNSIRRLCNRLAMYSYHARPSSISIQRCSPYSNGASTSQKPSTTNGDQNDLIISDRAIDRLKKIAADGEYLRILVDSGGCSGFEYKFQLVTAPETNDRVYEKDGVKVLVDDISLDFLRGATIDYQMELIKAAFRVVQNPKAEKGCSCGTSFALKTTPSTTATTATTKTEEKKIKT